jgi:hypothetical protein
LRAGPDRRARAVMNRRSRLGCYPKIRLGSKWVAR